MGRLVSKFEHRQTIRNCLRAGPPNHFNFLNGWKLEMITDLRNRGMLLSPIFIFLLRFRAGVSLLFVPRDNAANNGSGKAPPISYTKFGKSWQ